MIACQNCGSIQLARARSTTLDKAFWLLTRRRPFVCRRCGWRARERWANPPPPHPPSIVKPDQDELAALDRLEPEVVPPAPVPDLTNYEPPTGAQLPALAVSGATPVPRRGPTTRRRRRSRGLGKSRREIVGAVAMTAVVGFVLLMFILVGSCSTDGV